jgi:hypothetical protein
MASKLADEIGALFASARDAILAEIAGVQAALPGARERLAAAREKALDEGRRLNAINGRIVAAARNSPGGTAPALVRLFDEARRRRDIVDAAEVRARMDLAELERRVASLADDLSQADRALNGVPLEHRPEVIKRPTPGPEFVDPIVFPSPLMPGAGR